MNTIAKIQANFKKLDLAKVAMQVVKENDEKIINLNKKQLFGSGTDSEDNKLKRYRNGMYAMKKNEMNPSPGLGNPDLFNTGDFFKKFKLTIINKNVFEMDSKDVKAKDLEKKYGKDIFGISEQSKKEMIEKFYQDELMTKIKEVTKL